MAFVLRKPPSFSPKTEAFPYQMDAIRAVRSKPYAAIFHEQGLGKTKMAIDIALYWLEKDVTETVFIITKKSLVKNWSDEIKVHSHITPRVLSDNRRANGYALNAPVLIYILNYEVCSSNLDLIRFFQKTCRVGAILDESQKIKNPEAQLTKCFMELAEGFVRKIIMTGTPVANRPYDIWSQVYFLDGGVSLGQDYESFKKETDIPERPPDSETYLNALGGVYQKVKDFSVRETKKTSGIELPEKIILSHKVDLMPEQQKIYRSYRDELRYEIDIMGDYSDDAENILKRLLRLIQCASNPVLIDTQYTEKPAKLIKTRELLDKQVRHDKAIIWTSFIDNAEWLATQLSEHSPATVHGSMSIESRNNALDRFKEQDTCKILIATPGAAKEGLTLTVANHSIFYDRSFSLDDYLQAQDRIHRISQDKPCYINNLIAKDTVDEWVDQLLYVKYVAAQITQGDVPCSGEEGKKFFQINLSDVLRETLYPENSKKL